MDVTAVQIAGFGSKVRSSTDKLLSRVFERPTFTNHVPAVKCSVLDPYHCDVTSAISQRVNDATNHDQIAAAGVGAKCRENECEDSPTFQ